MSRRRRAVRGSRTHRRVRDLLLAATAACGVATGAPGQSPIARGSIDVLRAAVLTSAEDVVRVGALGAVIAIEAPGTGPIVRAAGHVDRERRTPMDLGRHFQIASQTKMFVAASILRLVKDGALRLDQRLADYIPDYAGSPGVTLRHLLTHTSGIGDAVELFWPARIYPTDRFTFDELLMMSRVHGQQYEAGARFKYNETGMYALGRIVELETGRPLGQFVRNRITGPLGMTDTYTGASERWPGDKMARGYFRRPGSDSTIETTTHGDYNLSWAFAAGDMISTAADLMKWAGALLDPTNPSGLSLEDFTSERVARSADGSETGYGLGFAEQNIAGRTVWGHGGNIYGYLSLLTVDPASRVRIVVLTNLDGDPAKSLTAVYNRGILSATTALLHLVLGIQSVSR